MKWPLLGSRRISSISSSHSGRTGVTSSLSICLAKVGGVEARAQHGVALRQAGGLADLGLLIAFMSTPSAESRPRKSSTSLQRRGQVRPETVEPRTGAQITVARTLDAGIDDRRKRCGRARHAPAPRVAGTDIECPRGWRGRAGFPPSVRCRSMQGTSIKAARKHQAVAVFRPGSLSEAGKDLPRWSMPKASISTRRPVVGSSRVRPPVGPAVRRNGISWSAS